MKAFYLSLFVNLFVLFFSEFTETYLLACLVDYFDNNPDFKRSVMLDLDCGEHNMALKNRAPLWIVTRIHFSYIFVL